MRQAAISLLVALWLGGCSLLSPAYQFKGSLIEPAHAAPDFRLTTHTGHSFTLSQDRGEVTLLFFGYTHCPDVCPATLSEYRQIIQQLGAEASRVRFVFVTIDPQRDTAELLGAHVTLFDPAILGLTGSEAELTPVWDAYGVVRHRRESDSAAGYTFDHTARMYLVDPAGDLRLTYPFGFPVEQIVQDIEHLLAAEKSDNG